MWTPQPAAGSRVTAKPAAKIITFPSQTPAKSEAASDYPRPLGAARVPRPRLSDAIAADNPIRRDLTAAIKVLEHAQRGHVRESEAIALALELLWGIE